MPQATPENFLGDQHDCQYASDPRKNKELGALLKGRHALIAGAGRGIGRATAEFFAHTEIKYLSLTALELEEVDETARLCKYINPNLVVKTAAFDVRIYDQVQQFTDETESELGDIDVLFMNAGRPGQWLATHESDPQIWWDTVSISLQGAFNFSRAVLPKMRQRKTGCVIFTASLAAHITNGMSAYMLGKLGVIRLCENLHWENKDCGIKTFAIHPGATITRMYTDFKDAAEGNIKPGSYVKPEVEGEKKSAQIAMQFFKDVQWDTPQMAAGMVVVLASGQLDFLSGRYVDCSKKIVDYIAEQHKIKSNDLYRMKLTADIDRVIPVMQVEE